VLEGGEGAGGLKGDDKKKQKAIRNREEEEAEK